MAIRRAPLVLSAMIGIAIVGGEWMKETRRSVAQPPPRSPLRNGEPSIDSLLEKFRLALATKDKALLRRLRVTEDEYRNFILPGSVEEGQPPGQSYSEQASQYFWGVLNGKSIYSEANLLADFGGHDLKIKSIEYRKGIKKYRDYTAYKQLTVELENEEGNPGHMRIGSIAEAGGQYKFISYVRD